jgi:hypothetical protein
LFGLATAFVGNGNEDAKAEISANWRFPTVGLEIYGSLGMDDYVPGGIRGYIRYPFHTMVYQIGLKKGFSINPQKQISGDLIFEWTNMEMSQDAQTQWAYNFYSHEMKCKPHELRATCWSRIRMGGKQPNPCV